MSTEGEGSQLPDEQDASIANLAGTRGGANFLGDQPGECEGGKQPNDGGRAFQG